MLYPLLFNLWWIGFLAPSPVQTIQYDIFHDQEKVGELEVVRFSQLNQTIVQVEMNVEIQMIMSVQLRSTYETKFEGGQMTSAQVRSYCNGNLHSYTNCWKKGDVLHIDKDGARSEIKEAVNYTITQAYFQPPTNKQRVFSERWGTFQEFELAPNGGYVQHLSNGDRSYYHYRSGVCQSIKLDSRFFTLSLKKK